MKAADQGVALAAGKEAESQVSEQFMSTRSGNTSKIVPRFAGQVFAPGNLGMSGEFGRVRDTPYAQEWASRAMDGPGGGESV
jgi:hypothetical protein